jgi:hypothetical protein
MEESPGPQPHDIPLLSSSNVLPSPRPSPVPEAPPSAPASNRLGVLVSAAIRSNLGSLMAAQLAHGQERPLPLGGPPRQPSSLPAYPFLARSPPPSRPRTTVVSTSSPCRRPAPALRRPNIETGPDVPQPLHPPCVAPVGPKCAGATSSSPTIRPWPPLLHVRLPRLQLTARSRSPAPRSPLQLLSSQTAAPSGSPPRLAMLPTDDNSPMAT